MKSLVKKVLRFFVWLLTRSALGRQVHEQFLIASIALQASVQHLGFKMNFVVPNALTFYRVDTFSTKEPETLIWLDCIPRDAVLWDVGANVGLYSIYAAQKVGVRVYAFEPSVFNLELLARNIFLNDLENRITIVPIALSDKVGQSLFNLSTTAWGGALSTFGRDFDQNGGKLNTVFKYKTVGITMCDAVNLLGIPVPSFIKIDVDGLEHFILRGGSEILKHVESVLVEINDAFTEQAEESGRLLQLAGLTLLRKCDIRAGTQFNQWWVRQSR